MMQLKSESGTYVLIFHSQQSRRVQIGKWGAISLSPGYYLYVGSAFGPGGLNARVSRHARKDKAKHWHIDYPGDYLELINVWYSYDTCKLEHQWAQTLSTIQGMRAIPGFGCTDCQCKSHFFQTDRKPAFKPFAYIARGDILEDRIVKL